MIPDCDGRSDGQTESIIANTALCIARAMLTRCKNHYLLHSWCTKDMITCTQISCSITLIDSIVTLSENNVTFSQ